MPELPEVETIKRQLKEKVLGHKILKIEVLKLKQFRGDQQRIIGARILDVRRRAKNIIIDLDDKLHLLIHLKMTGQLIFSDKNNKYGGGHPIAPFGLSVPNKYTHIRIYFTDKSKLYYNDVRQFGWMKVLDEIELKKEFEKFGPEPLDKEFDFNILNERIKSKNNMPIKIALMDQSVIVGLGNIYANELLFNAGIDPRRKVKTLTKKELEKIFNAINIVLKKAIKYQGTSADDYVTLEGEKGHYDEKLWIYDKKDEKCPNKCGGIIEKIKLGGRGTYFCSKCQK